MKIRCIIVDDEPFARNGIREEIKEIGFLEWVGSAANAMEANELLTTAKPDLVFLDIQMPKISGLDFLQSLVSPPAVIVITAFSAFALEGFNLDVIDYLVKPVAFARLLKACNKARDFMALRQGALHGNKPEQGFFFIKYENIFEKIYLDELFYVEGADNYVFFHTKEKKMISYVTLKSVEEWLPRANFIKVHKSFIVAMNKITHIKGNRIAIKNELIPMSRGLKEVIMSQIVNRNLIRR